MSTPPTQHSPERLADIAARLASLADAMVKLEQGHHTLIDEVAPCHRPGARNLLHYLAMRRLDLRTLQAELTALGLSSLGRSEANILASVQAIRAVIRKLAGTVSTGPEPTGTTSGPAMHRDRLTAHTAELLGPEPADRATYMMVTMPSEAAHDFALIEDLLDRGMNCMRINCARDGREQWLQMIEHLHSASARTRRQCTILMDLGGPKLRTGEVEPGPAVLRLKPKRDAFGRTIAPARIWLTARDAPRVPPSAAAGVLNVEPDWLTALQVGDRVRLRDKRDRRRELAIVDRDRGGVWGEMNRTAYVTNGTQLQRLNGAGAQESTVASGIPATEGAIPVAVDDLLVLTADPVPGRAATFDSSGRLLGPARIACTLPSVLADVKPGERVCIDDGRITGRVLSASARELRIRVVQTPARGGRLKGDKGVNLPDSQLHLPALTGKDLHDLDFVVEHADMVGLSFVNNEDDVTELLEALGQRGGRRPGIVLKIETHRGFQRLPAMLLTAMRHERVGVMIARGDLAVECGYERLAEVQEEILWICEAAHIPVIWATQVLEKLAKEGTPSRAEITDAAMGNRAECVMLNKGPHIGDALRVLDDILKRMGGHQSKKRAMLRSLKLATDFDPDPPSAAPDDAARPGAPLRSVRA